MVTLRSSEFKSSKKHLLFTLGARILMEKLSNHDEQTTIDNRFYLHWNNRTKVILVYGTNAQRQRGLSELHSLTEEMDRSYVEKTLNIKPQQKIAVRAFLQKLKTDCTLDSAILMGGKLHVLGTREAVSMAEVKLGASLETLQVVNKAKGSGDRACCAYCGDDEMEAEQRLELITCNHIACSDCYRSMFLAVESGDSEYILPVVCKLCAPQTRWALADIQSIASEHAFSNLKAASIRRFVLESEGAVRYCSSNGCDQVIDFAAAVRPDPDSPQEANLGGFILCCDGCGQSYCDNCTTDQNSLTPPHISRTCKTYRGTLLPSFQACVNHVVESILCIRCPRCQDLFIDFDGCFALLCSYGAHFCAYCLEIRRDVNDTHNHVAKCKLGNGQLFNAKEAFYATHRVRWEKELDVYLRSITDSELRSAVAAEVAIHARYVGITLEAEKYL